MEVLQNKAIKWDRITHSIVRLCHAYISLHGIELPLQVQGDTANKGKTLLCLGNCPWRLLFIIGDHILGGSEHVHISLQSKGLVIGFLLNSLHF